MKEAPFTMDEIDDKLNELTKSVEPPKDSKDLGEFYSKFYEKFNLGDKDNIQPYTYWRKESAPFYAYPLMYRNVIVWLPTATKEELEKYFECKMETLAEFVNNRLVSVVMGEPSGYFEDNGRGRPKDAYEPFFENLESNAAIAYGNTYEDAILNNDKYIDKLIDKNAKEHPIESKGGMIRFGDWVKYMEKQSPFKKLPDKLSKPIRYPPESEHPLIVDKPKNFVVERYCRLKLLEMVEKSGTFSAKLKGYAGEYPVKKIEDIVIPAFAFNYYSVPDFYSRGGFTTWHSWDMQQLSEIVLDYSGIGTKACGTVTCLRTAFFCEKKETKELLIDSQKMDHKKMLKQIMHIKSESDEFYNIMNRYPAVWDNVLKKSEKLVGKGEEDVKKYFDDIDKFATEDYIPVINDLNEGRAKILGKAAKIESGTQNFTSSIIRSAHTVHITYEMYELLTEGIVPYLLPVSIIAARFLEKPISERCGEAAEEFYFTRKTGLPFNLWGVRI